MAGLINIAVAFSAVAKKNDGLLRVLSEEMQAAGINTPLRVCHFLAQISHESAGFTRLVEGLNYSTDGLVKTWPNRFRNPDGQPTELAKKLHRNPQGVANNVYANRMGNGSPESGDGWKYRGRGFIMITGKSNYEMYSKIIFGDDRLVKNPDLCTDLSVAAKVACAYWNKNNLNNLADKDDLDGISDLINIGRDTAKVGDAVGYAHRKELTIKAKKAIGI